jgi:hypothetical protein
MNPQLKQRWQEEFETASVETVRQMLAEEPDWSGLSQNNAPSYLQEDSQ